MKIVFCGAGNVTKSCLANMLAAIRYVSSSEQLEIIIHNHILNHAIAAVMDLEAGMSFDLHLRKLKISSADDLIELANAELVIVTVGTYPSEQELSDARETGTDRELQSIVNYPIISEIATKIRQHAPNAYVIMVTNQVDFCTQLANDIMDFQRGRILGFGGLLDTNRYKLVLAKELNANYNIEVISINVTVVGHHNSNMFPLSNMQINGKELDEIIPDKQERDILLQSVLEKTRQYGASVTELNKGNVGSHLGPAALLSQTILAFIGMVPSFTAPFTVVSEGSAISIPVTISKLRTKINSLHVIVHQDRLKLQEISQNFQAKYSETKMQCEKKRTSYSSSNVQPPTFFNKRAQHPRWRPQIVSISPKP